jgi:hypothetical protein
MKVACPGEIAFRLGLVDRDQVIVPAKPLETKRLWQTEIVGPVDEMGPEKATNKTAVYIRPKLNRFKLLR